jgi:lysozyme
MNRWRSVSIGLTFALVAMFEGYRQVDYRDPVGVPTACFGHTATAQLGAERSIVDCEDLLLADIRSTQTAVLRHVQVPMNDNQLAAITSFVYNVGEGNFSNSTLLTKLNAGDYEGACNELPRWVYAKGIRLNGLVRRREQERLVCLTPAVEW